VPPLVQTGGARDYSPNNRGFAMADQSMRLNVRATWRPLSHWYLADWQQSDPLISLARLRPFAIRRRVLRRICPKKCRIPECRRQIRPLAAWY